MLHPRVGLLALLCALGASAVEPQADLAPLGLRTQGTLRELFLDVTSADARAPATLSLDVRYSLANDWGIPTTVTRGTTAVVQELDEQADSLSIAVRSPWSRFLGPGPQILGKPLWARLSSSLEVRATLHWGGWSDGAIEAWHDVSGAFNFKRSEYPRNQLALSLGEPGGRALFDVRTSTLAINDPVVRTQLSLLEGGVSSGALTAEGQLRSAWGVSLRLDVKPPLGLLRRLGGSGGWDGGIALLATAELTSWLTAHAMGSLSAFSSWSADFPLQPKPWHTSFDLSLAAGWHGWAFVIEDRAVSPLLMPGWDRVESGGNDGLLASTLFGSFRTHNQVTWAVRKSGFTVWFSEDFTPGANPRSTLKWLYNSNAPDVVLGVAYARPL